MTMTFTSRIPARQFGFESDATIPGFEPLQHPPTAPALIAPIDPDHVFEESFLKDLVLWWTADDTRTPLYISGPTGCGKTTSVLQFLARLNAASVSLTCSRRFVKDDLVGRWGAVNGGFSWFDGPATFAWKTGAILLINEFSLAPPEVWVGANDIFEGQSITIEKTGVTVVRHPNARVIITDNCRCGCSPDQNYSSRNLQDASTCDRFWHMTAKWLDEAVECRIVEAKCRRLFAGVLPEDILQAIAQSAAAFARATRKNDLNNRDRFCEDALAAVSTRVVLRLAEILARLLADGHGFDPSLERAVALSIGSAFSNAQCLSMTELAAFHFAALRKKLMSSKSKSKAKIPQLRLTTEQNFF